jgi:hypothetical protein
MSPCRGFPVLSGSLRRSQLEKVAAEGAVHHGLVTLAELRRSEREAGDKMREET